MRLFKDDIISHLIISTLFLTIALLFLALIIDARMLIVIVVLFIGLLIFLEICGTLKRRYLINQIKNLSEDENEDVINLIKEDKFLDTKEIRRALTILFTALYITVILGYVPCKDIKALSAVYGVIIPFYFGSRAIESSVIKLKR